MMKEGQGRAPVPGAHAWEREEEASPPPLLPPPSSSLSPARPRASISTPITR